MRLDKNNIEEWKKSLDKKMKERYEVDNFSQCNTNEVWLEDYEGGSDEDAISDETDYWDD